MLCDNPVCGERREYSKVFLGRNLGGINMPPDNIHRLATLTSRLAELLMAAALCADEIRAVVRTALDEEAGACVVRPEQGLLLGRPEARPRPLLDESTLCVVWNGRSLHLGHTLAFRLLQRLTRQPNQYVTHLDLLHDVWDNEFLAVGTIRSVMRNLKRKLRDGGMGELADRIRGHNGRYILDL